MSTIRISFNRVTNDGPAWITEEWPDPPSLGIIKCEPHPTHRAAHDAALAWVAAYGAKWGGCSDCVSLEAWAVDADAIDRLHG